MNTCNTCKHFENDEDGDVYDRGGICLLSQSGANKMMAARDVIAENSPYLEVSPQFGCNQHEEKME